MRMSNKNRFYSVPVSCNIGNIGKNIINTRHICIRERHSAVNNNNFIVIFKQGEIFADFVYAAEKHYSDGIGFFIIFRFYEIRHSL
jgi:hypothetical protein